MKSHFLATVKLGLDEEAWLPVWYSFIGHNFENDHSLCRHLALREDYKPRFSDASKASMLDVKDLLIAVADQSSLFLHGTHTNTNEALNGVGHSRVNKRLQRSVSGINHS